MKAFGIRKARMLLSMALLVMLLTCFSCVSALAATRVNVEEGTYYIKAVNGNAKGQVLYWNEKASDQNTSMMFESCGGSHADYEVWYIRKNRNFDDYYGIYLYKTYYDYNRHGQEYNNRIEIDNLTGRDQPYIGSTKGPHVFFGFFGNQDDAFEFVRESGNDDYKNLSIWSRSDHYRLNRHKEVKVFHSDLIYVNANKDNDTNNKLWELVPVNYERKLSKNSLSVSAQKNGKVTVDWKSFRDRIKNSKVWKNAKYIEIQYSTDKDFMKNTKTKTVEKGSVNKSKAKTALSKLDKNTTYYIRARLVDADGVASNWSKAVKITTKGGKWQVLFNGTAKQFTMTVGDTLDLKSELSLEDAELTWQSSDADIAAVSEDGVVMALKAGTAHITVANEDGDEASVTVLVKDAEGIVLLDGVDDSILSTDGELTLPTDGELVLPTDGELTLPTDGELNETIEVSIED